MKKNVLAVITMMTLILSACTPAATQVPTEVPTAVVESTAVPTAVPEPTEEPTAVPTTLTVLAAASLTTPFQEIGKLFETAHPGVTVEFNFAGSQQLAEQLAQGAPADVFASASTKYMTAAVDAGRVSDSTQKTFARNGLVMIYPIGNPGGVTSLKDLAKPGLKLVLAAAEVPVGGYTVQFLDKAVTDPEYGKTFKDDVQANVVSYEDNVKSVLAKVALGEADAGIVYRSDVTGDDASKVTEIEIPEALNVIAMYPIAAVADSKNAELAAEFVDLVLSDEGQAELTKVGFLPAPTTAAATPIEFKDALGRQLHFDKSPEKIVVTGKALFMVADAIYTFPDAGDRITAIGSTAQSNNDFIALIDKNLDQKTKLESNAGAEQIAAVQPDCVILKSSMAESLGKPLEELKIPVVYVDFETPDQYFRDIDNLGILFQNQARAAEVKGYFQKKMDAVTAVTAGLTDDQKPTTLLLYYNVKDGAVSFNVPPASWMQTTIVESAGGKPVWLDANPGSGWAKVSLEQIAAWNPNMIFIVSYFTPVDEVVAQLKADPQWQALDAVKNEKIYGFATDMYSWDQPDPRWILGLTWTAGKLHPDLFPHMDITAEAKEFYQTLYGMDGAAFEKDIQPLMTGDIH